ncbi:MAG: response regulator [Candidatus Thermoplasmatota archaeon]|nr:response regulator [Candidatus Thermoplasmatota archaeon]
MGKKIMVVDDSNFITYTVKDALEQIDPSFTVTRVESGKQCIELLEKNQIPDLILLDIMMPEISGWEVFKKLRTNKTWKNIPVAFLTAKSDNFSRAFGKILAEAYIEKPFEIHDLKNKIERLLEKPLKISQEKQKIIDDMLKHIPDS